MRICCVFELESPHRGDYNEYTQHTIINILKKRKSPKIIPNIVKPVIVATSIKQATCSKQACIQFPKQANILTCTRIKQAHVF